MTGCIFGKPYIWLILSWLSAGLLSIFEPGGLLPPPSFILAVVLLLSTSIAWLVMMVHAVVSRRLGCFILLTASGLFGLSLVYFCVRFSDEIHFQIMRPIYLIQIKSSSRTVTEKEWDWCGGSSYDESLLYLRNPTPSRLLNEKDDPDEKTTVEKMSDHFFVIYSSWE